MDPDAHFELVAPPAGLKGNALPISDTAFHFASRIFLPSSPTLTEVSCSSTDSDSSSMEVDWVTDVLDNEQNAGAEFEAQEALDAIVRQQAKEAREKLVSERSTNVKLAKVASNNVQESNSTEEHCESYEDLSTVLLRRANILECTIDELRECLCEALGKQQYHRYMLARTIFDTQAYATPATQPDETTDEQTTWTKSGQKFYSKEAARRSSSSFFSGGVQSDHEKQALRARSESAPSTTHGQGDSDAEGETDNEGDSDADGETDNEPCWDFYDQDMLEVDMDCEASDDDAESVYEPSHNEVNNASEMEVDSDENADVEPQVQ